MSEDEITVCSCREKKKSQKNFKKIREKWKVHHGCMLVITFFSGSEKIMQKYQSFCRCWCCFSSETVAQKWVKRLSIYIHVHISATGLVTDFNFLIYVYIFFFSFLAYMIVFFFFFLIQIRLTYGKYPFKGFFFFFWVQNSKVSFFWPANQYWNICASCHALSFEVWSEELNDRKTSRA